MLEGMASLTGSCTFGTALLLVSSILSYSNPDRKCTLDNVLKAFHSAQMEAPVVLRTLRSNF